MAKEKRDQMSWTEKSLKNPASVGVVVAILMVLGAITLFGLPIQLLPDIERPQISVITT